MMESPSMLPGQGEKIRAELTEFKDKAAHQKPTTVDLAMPYNEARECRATRSGKIFKTVDLKHLTNNGVLVWSAPKNYEYFSIILDIKWRLLGYMESAADQSRENAHYLQAPFIYGDTEQRPILQLFTEAAGETLKQSSDARKVLQVILGDIYQYAMLDIKDAIAKAEELGGFSEEGRIYLMRKKLDGGHGVCRRFDKLEDEGGIVRAYAAHLIEASQQTVYPKNKTLKRRTEEGGCVEFPDVPGTEFKAPKLTPQAYAGGALDIFKNAFKATGEPGERMAEEVDEKPAQDGIHNQSDYVHLSEGDTDGTEAKNEVVDELQQKLAGLQELCGDLSRRLNAIEGQHAEEPYAPHDTHLFSDWDGVSGNSETQSYAGNLYGGFPGGYNAGGGWQGRFSNNVWRAPGVGHNVSHTYRGGRGGSPLRGGRGV
ncbi:hypothetical protein LTR85_000301 [Meristemomyces frigidus]|nr:hypothetical protein LTR85_000301 [Meristemomyces frigidus]